MKPNKDRLNEWLKVGVCYVRFVKKSDNTLRDMACTQNLGIVPPENHPRGSKNLPEGSDLIIVFDVEKNGWRSFHWCDVVDQWKNKPKWWGQV